MRSARVPKIVLVLPAVATLVLSVIFWHGMRATDDLQYAQMAESVLTIGRATSANLNPTHHQVRIAMIYPLAAVFSVFGVSEASLALLPLVGSALAASLVAWLACWFRGAVAGLAAGLCYAVFPLTVELATFYVPESILAFETCLAAALFLRAIEGGARNPKLVQAAAGIVAGIAYLTSEVGALMLPILYAYLLLSQRRIRWRDASLAAGFLVVVIAELAYHAAVNGNPLYHFALSERYLNDPMLVDANRDLPYRLLKTIPAMFVYPNLDFGIFGPVLLLASLYGILKWRESRLFVVWAAVVLLFYNFMSVSLRHYVVLPLTERLLAPACLPLLALTGMMIADVRNWIVRGSSGIGRLCGRIAFVAAAFALIATSLLAAYLDVASPTFTGVIAWNAKRAAEFLQDHPAIVLVTDRRSASAMQFYRHFDPRDSFVSFEQASRLAGELEDDRARPAFVMLNGLVVRESEFSGGPYSRRFLGSGNGAAVSEFMPNRTADVFSARISATPLFRSLIGYAPVRYLLGSQRLRLAEQLFTETPIFGEVQVFPFKARSGSGPAGPT